LCREKRTGVPPVLHQNPESGAHLSTNAVAA
jgi:hypothetical protein